MLALEHQPMFPARRRPVLLGQTDEERCPTWTGKQIGITIGALIVGAIWGYFTAQGG